MKKTIALVCLLLACRKESPPVTRADEAHPVLPPGQEPLFSSMLGGAERLAGRCQLDHATIQARRVSAWYRCDGIREPLLLDLWHPAIAPPGATRTARLSVSAEATAAHTTGLFDAVLARVRARESAVRWKTTPTRPRVAGSVPGREVDVPPQRRPLPAPLSSSCAEAELSRSQRERCRNGALYLRERQYSYAVVEHLLLARDNPCCGALGSLAVSLAFLSPSPSLAALYAARAEAAPTDPLAQFIAGIVATEAAHRAVESREDKRALYARAEVFLSRAVTRWPSEARLWISLGVTQSRLGHAAEAAQSLARAEALSPRDAELALARAELLQPVSPAASLAALDTYVAEIAALEARRALLGTDDGAAARALRATMARAGAVDFDPPASTMMPWVLRPSEALARRPPGQIAARTVCLTALLLGLAMWASQRTFLRSSRAPRASASTTL